jgi:hypothetical protein
MVVSGTEFNPDSIMVVGRRNNVRKTLCTLIMGCMIAVMASFPLFAQEAESGSVSPQYSMGDQTFAINLGLFLPLFFMSWAPSTTPTNLSPGGAGSIQWQAYVTPQIRIGAEWGGIFAFSPNANIIFMTDLTAKASYVFTVYPFEIPVFLGAGINLVKYQDSLTFDILLKPGASFYWIFNSSWSFGLNLVYWWDLQFAADPAQSRAGNFLETTLSALYHF